jgi:hypothetical protein
MLFRLIINYNNICFNKKKCCKFVFTPTKKNKYAFETHKKYFHDNRGGIHFGLRLVF